MNVLINPSKTTRAMILMWGLVVCSCAFAAGKPKSWEIGAPIITYYCGPEITDATAKHMADAGFNLSWSTDKDLDTLHKHGIRAMIRMDDICGPSAMDTPEGVARLDALIDRVKNHPAMYAYYIRDEPGAALFPQLARVVAHIRERDPAHLAYLNLFPSYAQIGQLLFGVENRPGHSAAATAAEYQEHLRTFIEQVKPGLLSYDHYHFRADGTDDGQYFLNMALIRRAALEANIPWMNIVQGCTWTKEMRAPNGNELRWLHYTSLAYGAQALSYFVYWAGGLYDDLMTAGMPQEQIGMLYRPDGTTTPQYLAVKELNPQFVAVATQLRPLRSLDAYHVGAVPLGAKALPTNAPFALAFTGESESKLPATGMLLGYFGKPAQSGQSIEPTHVLVVNLDHQTRVTTTVVGPATLESFDVKTRRWTRGPGPRLTLTLPPGGGTLVRVRK